MRTVAVIPTINTLGLTACLTEHLLLCDQVDEVWLYDGGTDGTRAWAEHRMQTDHRLRWFDTRGVPLYDLWNRAILENSHQPTNVAILNSDIRLPTNAIHTMCTHMRHGGYQIATIDPCAPAWFSQHYDAWNPELAALTRPAPSEPYAMQTPEIVVVGWAYVVAAEFWAGEEYAIYPRFEWWYGDNDLFRRTAHRGGKICRVVGVGSDHLGSMSDPDNPNKAEKTARDAALYMAIWPRT